MNYNINPCKSCIDKYNCQEGELNINDINNCCYETLNAFYGQDCSRRMESCRDCVLSNLEQQGYTFCDKKISPPPIFNQVPHYIPTLLNQGYTPDEAKNKCLMLCDSGITKYPNECKEYCIVDYNAIEIDDEEDDDDDEEDDDENNPSPTPSSNFKRERYSARDNYHFVTPLKIDKGYNETLRLSQPYYFKAKYVKPGKGKLSDVQLLHYGIPPLNTDIRFRNNVALYSLSKNPRLQAAMAKPLPEVFDWLNEYPTDTDEIKQKKKLISTPMDQGMCGSCWAAAGAQVISDNFVVSGVVDFNPKISTTWAMSKPEYAQGKCEGGNPAQLFNSVSRGGITTNHCVDYSWCMTDLGGCKRDPTGHFKPSGNPESKIPPVGCYYDTEHYLFFIDDDVQSISIDNSIGTVEFRQTVKQHVYNHGATLAGFIVFNNFRTGEFSTINNGVYFDTGVYDGSGKIKFDSKQASGSNFLGAHAVSVIGWGIAKNTVIDNNGNKEDVPYWYARNSWDTIWGENGCFKMAMYPYNKYAQFDTITSLDTPQGMISGLGGMLLINATKKPEKKKLGQMKKSYLDKNLPRLKTKTYYEKESDEIKQNDRIPPDAENSNKSSSLSPLAIILLIIGALFLLMAFLEWLSRRNKQATRQANINIRRFM
jgi:hypothetical protein